MIAQYIREIGARQGQAKMLVSMLEARFGGIPGWVNKKIELADLAAIEKWAISLLKAEKIEDVFNA